MARITKKDLQKIVATNKYKGTIKTGVRWAIPSRKAKATAKAWTKKLGEQATKET